MKSEKKKLKAKSPEFGRFHPFCINPCNHNYVVYDTKAHRSVRYGYKGKVIICSKQEAEALAADLSKTFPHNNREADELAATYKIHIRKPFVRKFHEPTQLL